MKRYLLVCAVLLCFASCLKVEDANLCSNAPPAPHLANQNYPVALGGTLRASVTSPDASLSYVWISPYGDPYYGTSLTHTGVSNYDYGTWSVIAQKSAACSSDTTKFRVSYSVGNCDIGLDTMNIAGSAYSMSFLQGNYNFYQNYVMTFENPYGVIATITFPSQPAISGVYSVVDLGNSCCGYLSYSNQCAVSFTGGYVYTASSGNVSVTYNSGVLTILFCNVQFYYNSGTAFTSGSANLIGN